MQPRGLLQPVRCRAAGALRLSTTYCLPLTTYCSLGTTFYSPLTTQYSRRTYLHDLRTRRCAAGGAAARSATPPLLGGRRRDRTSPPNLRGGYHPDPRQRRRGSGAGAATRRLGLRRRGRRLVEGSPCRPGCQEDQSQLGRGWRVKERRLGAHPSGAVAGEGEVAARALLPLTAQIPLRDPGDLQKRAVGHDQTCVLHTLVTIPVAKHRVVCRRKCISSHGLVYL